MKKIHKQLLIILESYLKAYPNLRFTQALYNLNVSQNSTEPKFKNEYVFRDNHGDKDIDVLTRILKASYHLSEAKKEEYLKKLALDPDKKEIRIQLSDDQFYKISREIYKSARLQVWGNVMTSSTYTLRKKFNGVSNLEFEMREKIDLGEVGWQLIG